MGRALNLAQQLAAIVGRAHVLSDPDDLERYSGDEVALDTHRRAPLLVVRPGDEAEICAVLRLCNASGVPVTVRGGGTGLAAACVPSPDAVVLAMERLNRVVEVDHANATITAQAGVPLREIYQAVQDSGLFFPPHPGDESAHIGGAVATNAGGSRAVKYGTVKRFVLGLHVALADGTLLRLGGKLMKSSTGYHLAELMLGSEGTLGVITEVTLSLLPAPPATVTLVAPFSATGSAISAVPALLRSGVVPMAVEFVEHSVLRCAERLLERTWPTREGVASLMIVLDGTSADGLMNQAVLFGERLGELGALDVVVADSAAKQQAVLELRSVIYEALRPGTVEIFDITLPRAEVPGHVAFVHQLEQRTGMPLPTYGHAADGNVHTHAMRLAIDDGALTSPVANWPVLYQEVRAALYRDAIARGGTISGEHGIGLVKRPYLASTVGEEVVAVMRRIKAALDPNNILNPDKVLEPVSD